MKYQLDFKDLPSLELQIREHFFIYLQKVVEEELDHRAYRKYFDHFYQTGFYRDFDLRTKQLATRIHGLYLAESSFRPEEVDQKLDDTFQSFAMHFIIVHGTALHKMNLPQAILRYQEGRGEEVDLQRMIFDYLDFEQEPEKVYTDFLNMSKTKMNNAVNAFLSVTPGEEIYFICDQTIFGSCTEGFAMTDKALCWKSHFNPPGKVAYDQIATIKRESEWLTINDQFFNVSKTMNYKMMKLLQKLKALRS